MLIEQRSHRHLQVDDVRRVMSLLRRIGSIGTTDKLDCCRRSPASCEGHAGAIADRITGLAEMLTLTGRFRIHPVIAMLFDVAGPCSTSFVRC